MTQVTELEQDFEVLTQLPQPPERMQLDSNQSLGKRGVVDSNSLKST